MKVVQINSVSNSGSTGRIAEGIAEKIVDSNGESFIGYGRFANPSNFSEEIVIGRKIDIYKHGIVSLLLDRHGFGSIDATKKFIEKIAEINPDIVHLHNVHGYYLNIEILFDFLIKRSKPVVWTLHDCWAFTGHCSYYMGINCEKWMSECGNCPQLKQYPRSLFIDSSTKNFNDKKRLFAGLEKSKTILVTPSKWLNGELKKSYLKGFTSKTINNGINLEDFKPIENKALKESLGIKKDDFVIIGVAGVWDHRKGLSDFIALRKLLDNSFKILLVGLSKEQKKLLPNDIIGIEKTESVKQLAELYSLADIFFNPTYEDNFPTTNLEALACGTPVITYSTGGSPEAISHETGIAVPIGNINVVLEYITKIKRGEIILKESDCREHALLNYNQHDRFSEYISLYKELLNKN